MKAYPELDRYPTAEENSPYTIFIQGINPDAETSTPTERRNNKLGSVGVEFWVLRSG